MTIILILAIIGLLISLYTYFLEHKLRKNPQYKPVCDISDTVTCSKPLQSSYTRVFIISNSVAGMLFYGIVALLAVFHAITAVLFMAIAGALSTIVLIYILLVKIKSFCVVCITVDVINFLILLFAILAYAKETI